jgi:hypothetical protein
MSNWHALTNELDRWADRGLTATFWWRDDDVGRRVRELDRLLAVRSKAESPLALAVIPMAATRATAVAIRSAKQVAVLQHGYAHFNNAPPGKRKAEFGNERPVEAAVGELAIGRRRLLDLFGALVLDVFVPPWNRIAMGLVGKLSATGIRGLSTFGPRPNARPAPGLCQVNTHIDIIDWRGTRGFVGTPEALAMAINHLRARRTNAADPNEPTGLLSHHRVHDEAAWTFVAAFLAATAEHTGARWLCARDVFASHGEAEIES